MTPPAVPSAPRDPGALTRLEAHATDLPAAVAVVVPGEPVAQGRGRAVRIGDGLRVVDPSRSRSWKACALTLFRDAVGPVVPFPEGPLLVEVDAFHRRPKSLPKRLGPGRLPRPSRPDADNVGKIVCDAGNGTLWGDDAQVCTLIVRKWFAAQGEAPRVEVRVARWAPAQAPQEAPGHA